jgi:magnesium transporter
MTSFSTFYLSRIVGLKVYSDKKRAFGTLQDLMVDPNNVRPKVIGAKIKFGKQYITIDISHISIKKIHKKYLIYCDHIEETKFTDPHILLLVKHLFDKQIVDIDGRKLERVNDIRLAVLPSGVFVVAVDVGIEGLLRRLSFDKFMNSFLRLFNFSIPGKLITWDDVAAISQSQYGIKLSKEHSKLSTLHPSDLADIIEDLDRKTQLAVFSSLDEQRAADVLEEMETEAQIKVLEGLSLDKAADVLEKMPADEVADILDDLEEAKAEELLDEMEHLVSQEVRELMEYPDNTVGSLMSTDFFSFNEEMTVEDSLKELRVLKPETDAIYYLYVLDTSSKLIAVVSLRDIVISEPHTRLNQIMNRQVIKVNDYDKIDSLAEIISKYNLIAIPVVNSELKMMGIIIIDDVVFTLLKARKRKVLREE